MVARLKRLKDLKIKRLHRICNKSKAICFVFMQGSFSLPSTCSWHHTLSFHFENDHNFTRNKTRILVVYYSRYHSLCLFGICNVKRYIKGQMWRRTLELKLAVAPELHSESKNAPSNENSALTSQRKVNPVRNSILMCQTIAVPFVTLNCILVLAKIF